MFQLNSHSIAVLCNTFPILSPYPRCDVPSHWHIQNVVGYSWQRLSCAKDGKQLRTTFYQDKMAVSNGYRGHYLPAHVSVSGRGRHGWAVNYSALKRAFLIWGSPKDFGKLQAKKTSAVWYSLTWSFLGTWLVLIRFLFLHVIRLMWTQHGTTSFSSSYNCCLLSVLQGQSNAI